MSPTSKAPRKKYGRRLLTARSRGDIGSTTAMPPTGRWGLRGGTKISTMRVWVDIVGHVVEISPPRHLVLTWAFPKDVKDPDKVSRVTFDIETYGDGVRLTVTHSDLEPELRDATGDHEGLAARAVQPKDSARDRKAATRNLYAHDQAAGVMGRHFNCAQGWSREGQAETDTILAPACLSHRGPCRLCHDPKPPQTSCRPRP